MAAVINNHKRGGFKNIFNSLGGQKSKINIPGQNSKGPAGPCLLWGLWAESTRPVQLQAAAGTPQLVAARLPTLLFPHRASSSFCINPSFAAHEDTVIALVKNGGKDHLPSQDS